jgi:hypothetical protein
VDDLEARQKAHADKVAVRNAEFNRAQAEQELTDLEAIFELEEEFGVRGVEKVKTEYTKGLPMYLAVRCPTPAEIKRFRDRTKPDARGNVPNVAKHVDELAVSCMLYPKPDSEEFAEICRVRPAVLSICGRAAAELAAGEIANEGKD